MIDEEDISVTVNRVGMFPERYEVDFDIDLEVNLFDAFESEERAYRAGEEAAMAALFVYRKHLYDDD